MAEPTSAKQDGSDPDLAAHARMCPDFSFPNAHGARIRNGAARTRAEKARRNSNDAFGRHFNAGPCDCAVVTLRDNPTNGHDYDTTQGTATRQAASPAPAICDT